MYLHKILPQSPSIYEFKKYFFNLCKGKKYFKKLSNINFVKKINIRQFFMFF